MKKLLTIIVIFVSLCLQTVAQADYGFGTSHKKGKIVPIAGLKLGYTSYDMKFSDKDYDKLPGKSVNALGYGLFVDFPLQVVNGLSVGVEALLVEKGYSKEFNARPNGINVAKKEAINAKYLDIRIPVSYRFLPDKMINPYVFVAPDLSFCYGGTQKHEFPDNSDYPSNSVNLSKTDAVLSQSDISFLAGIGIRFNITVKRNVYVVKLDGAYNFGLTNVKSQKDGEFANVHAWYSEDKDTWKNKGFELMLSVGIPLIFDRMEGACKKW